MQCGEENMNFLTWEEKTPDDGEIVFNAYLGKWKVGTIYTLNDQKGYSIYYCGKHNVFNRKKATK
jgi:hypothetical protein